MHRDLYLEALSRISELELDGASLQNLTQCMQDMRVTMVRHKQSYNTCSMLLSCLILIHTTLLHVSVFKDFLHLTFMFF